MEAESSTSNQQRKRKRSVSDTPDKPAQSTWRTDKEHRLYSSKLLEALRRVRSGSTLPRTEPPRSRAIREAADRALAISARGRSRWSRAILSSRSIRLKSNRIRFPVPSRPNRTELVRNQVADREKKKSVVLQRKARVLGRLVPGCKKLSFPILLEEASDYIKALEMQVKAMSALTEILSMIGGGTEGVPGPVQESGADTSTTSTGINSLPPPA
ncbi:transcription factor bHLH148-like [Carex rostrata]